MNTAGSAPERVAYTDHLVWLVARAEVAAARVAGADPDRRGSVVAAARRAQARLSVRLDGSPLEDDTAATVDRAQAGPDPGAPGAGSAGAATPAATGGWASALKLEGMATQDVAAVEYANMLACFDAEPELADELFASPREVLEALHGRIVQGLAGPDVVGRLRRTDQAVHDGAQGRALYHPPPPQALGGLVDGLCAWLGRGSAGLPTVVVAGIVHERILEWLPFEAANGRLARAASRLVLRVRGLDPHGAGVTERVLAEAPLDYYAEVAATVRRRGDLAPWLERYAEAVVAGLEDAAAQAAPRPALAPPARAAAVAAGLGEGETITPRDYGERAGVNAEAARADLRALTSAGLLREIPGTRGLRFRRAAAP